MANCWAQQLLLKPNLIISSGAYQELLSFRNWHYQAHQLLWLIIQLLKPDCMIFDCITYMCDATVCAPIFLPVFAFLPRCCILWQKNKNSGEPCLTFLIYAVDFHLYFLIAGLHLMIHYHSKLGNHSCAKYENNRG